MREIRLHRLPFPLSLPSFSSNQYTLENGPWKLELYITGDFSAAGRFLCSGSVEGEVVQAPADVTVYSKYSCTFFLLSFLSLSCFIVCFY